MVQIKRIKTNMFFIEETKNPKTGKIELDFRLPSKVYAPIFLTEEGDLFVCSINPEETDIDKKRWQIIELRNNMMVSLYLTQPQCLGKKQPTIEMAKKALEKMKAKVIDFPKQMTFEEFNLLKKEGDFQIMNEVNFAYYNKKLDAGFFATSDGSRKSFSFTYEVHAIYLPEKSNKQLEFYWCSTKEKNGATKMAHRKGRRNCFFWADYTLTKRKTKDSLIELWDFLRKEFPFVEESKYFITLKEHINKDSTLCYILVDFCLPDTQINPKKIDVSFKQFGSYVPKMKELRFGTKKSQAKTYCLGEPIKKETKERWENVLKILAWDLVIKKEDNFSKNFNDIYPTDDNFPIEEIQEPKEEFIPESMPEPVMETEEEPERIDVFDHILIKDEKIESKFYSKQLFVIGLMSKKDNGFKKPIAYFLDEDSFKEALEKIQNYIEKTIIGKAVMKHYVLAFSSIEVGLFKPTDKQLFIKTNEVMAQTILEAAEKM
jgi:hypothetical protein